MDNDKTAILLLMKSKSWSCFVEGCNFSITKTENELTDYRRSLGLARHNHLRKHTLTEDLLENWEYWKKQPYPKRDEVLRHITHE